MCMECILFVLFSAFSILLSTLPLILWIQRHYKCIITDKLVASFNIIDLLQTKHALPQRHLVLPLCQNTSDVDNSWLFPSCVKGATPHKSRPTYADIVQGSNVTTAYLYLKYLLSYLRKAVLISKRSVVLRLSLLLSQPKQIRISLQCQECGFVRAIFYICLCIFIVFKRRELVGPQSFDSETRTFSC